MAQNIKIAKREHAKGEDGYQVFSIRIRQELKDKLDEVAQASGRSRNEVIAAMLTYGVANCEIVD